MLYPLIFTVLSPLLLLQGLYVRKVTPRLPEASGDRSGSLGSGPPLRVLILGDSAAAGVGVQLQTEALSGQLSKQLARTYQTSWQLWATNGNKCQNLIELLEKEPQQAFDVVLVSIGVNDVTGGTSQQKWLVHIQKIIELLFDKFSAQQIIFTALPPMHHFPALPQPLRWVFGLRATQFNAQMQRKLASTSGCTLLKLVTPFEMEYIAIDGFHPNDKTYKIWAREAALAIQCTLK